MIEYLALPGWKTPPRTVEDWLVSLSETAGPATVRRESPTVSWLEVASIRLRAYVVVENGHAAAINFEVHDLDPGPATRAIEDSASALGWEVHADDEEDREDAAKDEDDE